MSIQGERCVANASLDAPKPWNFALTVVRAKPSPKSQLLTTTAALPSCQLTRPDEESGFAYCNNCSLLKPTSKVHVVSLTSSLLTSQRCWRTNDCSCSWMCIADPSASTQALPVSLCCSGRLCFFCLFGFFGVVSPRSDVLQGRALKGAEES